MIRTVAAAFAMLVVIACGSTPSTAVQGPTAAEVAMQASDLPSGMQKCTVSGDIDSYLNSIKTKDPSAYTTTNCKALESNTSGVSGATYKLAVNFVLQFKDAASAAKGYTTESIMGFS